MNVLSNLFNCAKCSLYRLLATSFATFLNERVILCFISCYSMFLRADITIFSICPFGRRANGVLKSFENSQKKYCSSLHINY